MDELKVKNAVIADVGLSNADHGILSAWLSLDFDACHRQGFGGYFLYTPNMPSQGVAGHFIWRVLQITGASDWSAVKYKNVRIKTDGDKIHAIGHIIKDDWFDPKAEFDKLRGGDTNAE